MSLRSRLALAVAAVALALGTAACSGGASSEPAEATLPPAEAAACAAMTAFADAVFQFEGVDVAAIGASNLAPQVNRLRGTFTAVATSLDFVEVPGEAALLESWATFDDALRAINQDAPTQEQVDAAKAAGAVVRTDFTTVQSELGCPTTK